MDVESKNRTEGRWARFHELAARACPALDGRMLKKGWPLASVGMFPEQMSCVCGRKQGWVMRVRGIHSMIDGGSQLLFELLASVLFGDPAVWHGLIDPLFSAKVDFFEAIIPVAPLHPMPEILAINLGALSVDNYETLAIINPAVLAEIKLSEQ